LPEPLGRLSPWLDWTGLPRDEVYARLALQSHRRIIKSHTPLDGIPLDERATYVVMGRHPLDMAVSLYHQIGNINRSRLRQLTGQPEPVTPAPPRPTLHDWLLSWTEWDGNPEDQLDSLPGVFHHVGDAWARRRQSNIVLVHYDDLAADLEGAMRRLATVLAITVPEATWPLLVRSAEFDTMRAAAEKIAPDPADILIDHRKFFRRGTSGAGREVLTDDEWGRYRRRVELMAPPDLLAWVHHEQ
jgi:hypothetical protein